MSGLAHSATTTTDFLAAGLGALAVFLVLLGVQLRLRRRAVSRRLSALVQPVEASAPLRPRGESGYVLALTRLGALVAARLPTRLVSALQRQALRAGHPAAAADKFLGFRVASVAGGGVLALAFASADGILAQLGALLVAVIAISAVDLLLKSQADARRRAATRDLPTLLDLLSLTMGAGMGFDLALSTILDNLGGPLTDELRRYLGDVNDLGVARAEALESVALRLGDPPDLVAFVEAVNRAHLLGTGLMAAVASQTSLLRQEHRRRAAAAAQRAPVRMLIPMTLFMLPVLMLVVLGPVALRVMNAVH
jgi:tight adherence protein C